MPRRTRSAKGLTPDCTQQFMELVKSAEGKQLALDFVLALADMMDDIITEEDTYITFGMSKDGTRFNFVFHSGRLVYYANGVDVKSLLQEAISL